MTNCGGYVPNISLPEYDNAPLYDMRAACTDDSLVISKARNPLSGKAELVTASLTDSSTGTERVR